MGELELQADAPFPRTDTHRELLGSDFGRPAEPARVFPPIPTEKVQHMRTLKLAVLVAIAVSLPFAMVDGAAAVPAHDAAARTVDFAHLCVSKTASRGVRVVKK